MPKYKITIRTTRTIDFFGEDKESAVDAACEIVRKWQNVDDVEAIAAEVDEE